MSSMLFSNKQKRTRKLVFDGLGLYEDLLELAYSSQAGNHTTEHDLYSSKENRNLINLMD